MFVDLYGPQLGREEQPDELAGKALAALTPGPEIFALTRKRQSLGDVGGGSAGTRGRFASHFGAEAGIGGRVE